MTGFLWWCATNFLEGRRINPIWARRRREMGVSCVRYWPQWADLVAKKQPADLPPDAIPVLDFQQLDDDIGVMREAGLEIDLNLNGIAPYAVAGSTVYLEGVKGCLWWVDPNDGSKGLRFTPERPGCTSPPDPNPVAVSDIAARLLRRYPFLKMISFLNEPDDRISSAAIMNQTELRFGGDWSKTSAWVTDKFLVPFYQGAKSTGISVPVAGGDFATAGFAAASIRHQQATGVRAWDWSHTTHHLYASDPAVTAYDSLDAPGGFTAYFNELRDRDGINIPVRYITETDINPAAGEKPDDRIDLIARLHARGDIGAVTFLGDWFFKPESCANDDPMRNTYEPDGSYDKVVKLMQQLEGQQPPLPPVKGGKHRGARH